MRDHPPYMPPAITNDDPFVALYADSVVVGFSTGKVTTIKRIRPRSSIEQVYGKLPSAPDFEYFGYLTKTQIAYGEGFENSAPYIDGKLCLFHSHPTMHPKADIPSPSDVYFFLKQPWRRAITVGRNFIWWWDKDQSLVKTIRRLMAWESENLVACCTRLSSKENWAVRYKAEALAGLGCKASQFKGQPAQWTQYLWQTLRLKTTILDRTLLGRRRVKV